MDADAPGQTAPTDPDALRHEQADQLLRDYLREAEPIRGVLPVTMFAGGRFRPAAAVDLASGRAVLEAEPPLQIAFLLAALDWSLDQIERHRWTWEFDQLAALTAQLLRRRQPYTAADVEWILERLAGTSATWHDIHGRFGYSLRSPLRSVARWCDDQPLPRESVNALARLRSRLAEAEAHADGRDLLELIDQVLGEDTAARDLIDPRDDWGHHAAAALSAMEPASRRAWLEFLRHAAACAGSKPSKKWLVQASGQIVALGNDPFRELVTAWFGFLNEPSRNTTYRRPDGFDFPSSVIADRNADLLKGLAWCCAAVDDDALALTVGDATLACFKKIPGIGARSPRAGNAGAVALSLMPGLGGVAQLQRLSGRVKLPSVQKQIEAALERAAVHSGLAREDLEELAVPDFGLRDGRACVSLGDVAAEISLSGPDTVRLRWRSGLGREQATVPAEVKRDFPTELAALRQTIKAIQTALPAQRQRLERLLLAERRWTLNAWRARYLDHGQLAHLTRRLIWTFEQGAHAEQGMWLDGRVVDVLDRPLDRLDSETSVRPWHPIESSPEVILGWREWLERHQVAQPFKQAHREVYLLTDTERSAGTRSIRFGGHV
ncbi:MAG TPA: DUF4132 domain-containing protein, partial [Thermomicrobiaceae bacterium]|nr:DUF4132 domain-containing protein [Thermomicrobiaceae bacterium]